MKEVDHAGMDPTKWLESQSSISAQACIIRNGVNTGAKNMSGQTLVVT